MHLFEVLLSCYLNQRGSPALIDDEGVIMWDELPDIIDKVALGLVYQGMRRGKGVAILMDHCRWQSVAFLATIKGGGVAVAIPVSLDVQQMMEILHTSRPALLIHDGANATRAAELMERYEFREVISTEKTTDRESVWEKLENTDVRGANFPEIKDSSIIAHAYTLSPKGEVSGCAISGEEMWAANNSAVRTLRIRPTSRQIAASPSGLYLHELITRMLRTEGAIVSCSDTSAAGIGAAIANYKVNSVFAIGNYYERFFKWAAENACDLSSVRLYEARGKVPQNIKTQAQQRARMHIVETHSNHLSAGPFCHSPLEPDTEYKLSPLPDYDIDIKGGEKSGGIGEIRLFGEGMAGYHLDMFKGPVESHEDDDWVNTGETGYWSMTTGIKLYGSLYDVLFRDGRKLYLNRLSEEVESADGILKAEAVPIKKDGTLDVDLILAIQIERCEANRKAQILAGIKDKIAQGIKIDRVMLLDSFPRMIDGRVDRNRLCEKVDRLIASS